jgi:fibronectin type 3 domain-containing protein
MRRIKRLARLAAVIILWAACSLPPEEPYNDDAGGEPSGPGMSSGITLERAAGGGIRITWPPVTDAKSYSVFRSVNGRPYSRITAVPAANNSYTDTDISPGTDYDYKVSAAQDYLGEGPQSIPVCATTKAVPHPYIQMMVTGSGVDLSWNPIFRAAEYKVYKSTSGGADPGTLVMSPIATHYTDSPASAYYRVAAVNFDGSEFSGGYVSAPVGITLTPNASRPGVVDISWSADPGIIYNIYRAASSSGPFALVASSRDTSPYMNYGSSATEYYYKVAAVYAGSGEAQSDTVGAVSTYPNTPAGVTAVPGSTGTVEISWTTVPGMPGITYNIYRDTSSSGLFTTLVNSGIPASPYTDDDGGSFLTTGTTYYYKVSAVYSGLEGVQSEIVSVVAP